MTGVAGSRPTTQSEAVVKGSRWSAALCDCCTQSIARNSTSILDQAQNESVFIVYLFINMTTNQWDWQLYWNWENPPFLLSAAGKCFVRMKPRLWVPSLTPPISWRAGEAGAADVGALNGGSVRCQSSSPAAWQRH